ARRRQGARTGPPDRAPRRAWRLPPRRAAGRPGDPPDGGAVTSQGDRMTNSEAGQGATVPRVLAVIPARGGSKGVPAKNLAPVGGVPLVARAVRECRASRLVTD